MTLVNLVGVHHCLKYKGIFECLIFLIDCNAFCCIFIKQLLLVTVKFLYSMKRIKSCKTYKLILQGLKDNKSLQVTFKNAVIKKK